MVGPHIGVDVLEVLLTKVMIIKSAKVLPHNSKVVLTQIYTPAQTTHNITEHSHTRSYQCKSIIYVDGDDQMLVKMKERGDEVLARGPGDDYTDGLRPLTAATKPSRRNRWKFISQKSHEIG